MILFISIFLVFTFIIYKNAFFGLFRINKISNKTIAFLFFLKGLGVLAFYALYQFYYGDILNFDSGVFLQKVKL